MWGYQQCATFFNKVTMSFKFKDTNSLVSINIVLYDEEYSTSAIRSTSKCKYVNKIRLQFDHLNRTTKIISLLNSNIIIEKDRSKLL